MGILNPKPGGSPPVWFHSADLYTKLFSRRDARAVNAETLAKAKTLTPKLLTLRSETLKSLKPLNPKPQSPSVSAETPKPLNPNP